MSGHSANSGHSTPGATTGRSTPAPSASAYSTISGHSTTTANLSGSITSSYAASNHSLSSHHTVQSSRNASSQQADRVPNEFHFPRPSNEEIDRLFFDLVQSRNLDHAGSLSARNSMTQQASVNSAVARATATLPIDTKWQMVEADRKAKWEKARKQQRKEIEAIRSGRPRSQARTVDRSQPEYIVRKMLDRDISVSDLTTLNVSIRSNAAE